MRILTGQRGSSTIDILKHEIAIDAANLGVPDIKNITPDYVSYTMPLPALIVQSSFSLTGFRSTGTTITGITRIFIRGKAYKFLNSCIY
jgi:hypothetical protein